MRVAIVTVSDSTSQGLRPDRSGPALRERSQQLGWQVASALVVADETSVIQARLVELADSHLVDLILTTGGTGVGPRDITPESTVAVCEKIIPGLGELMREKGRQVTPRAALSRAIVGVRGRVVIVNLPGSPKGAVESLDAVADLLPHAVEILRGVRHD
jgi:molybdenum cofactor synthesis domain-containing protein